MGSDNGKVDMWFPLYIGDYLADTMHLTYEEHGVYLMLIMVYWKNQGPLPVKRITSICEKTQNQDQTIKTLSEFFDTESHEGYWYHKRIESELSNARERRKKAIDRGKKGAKARWSG